MALPAHVVLGGAEFDSFTNGTQADLLFGGINPGSFEDCHGAMVMPNDNTFSANIDCSPSALTSGWLSVALTYSVINNDQDAIVLSGATTPLIKFVVNSSEYLQCKYWNGGLWVDLGPSFYCKGASHMVDVFWNINAVGEFKVYDNRNLVGSFTGDTTFTADTTIDEVAFKGTTASYANAAYRSIIVDSADTRDLFISEDRTSSNGAIQGWSGWETSIDNYMNSIQDDLYIESTGSGSVSTYNVDNFSSATATFNVEAVYVLARANSTGASRFLKGACKIGNTVYTSENNFQPNNEGFKFYPLIFTVDPSTGIAWASDAAVESAEWGVKALNSV